MIGTKLDSDKPLAGLLMDFSYALMEVVKVGTFGSKKYTRCGWKSVPDGIIRYTDAMWRHLLAENHEQIDNESGLLHATHTAWNALARLELIKRATMGGDMENKRKHPGRRVTIRDRRDHGYSSYIKVRLPDRRVVNRREGQRRDKTRKED